MSPGYDPITVTTPAPSQVIVCPLMIDKGDSTAGAIEKGMGKALIIHDFPGGAMAIAARQGLYNVVLPVAGAGIDDITLEG